MAILIYYDDSIIMKKKFLTILSIPTKRAATLYIKSFNMTKSNDINRCKS